MRLRSFALVAFIDTSHTAPLNNLFLNAITFPQLTTLYLRSTRWEYRKMSRASLSLDADHHPNLSMLSLNLSWLAPQAACLAQLKTLTIGSGCDIHMKHVLRILRRIPALEAFHFNSRFKDISASDSDSVTLEHLHTIDLERQEANEAAALLDHLRLPRVRTVKVQAFDLDDTNLEFPVFNSAGSTLLKYIPFLSAVTDLHLVFNRGWPRHHPERFCSVAGRTADGEREFKITFKVALSHFRQAARLHTAFLRFFVHLPAVTSLDVTGRRWSFDGPSWADILRSFPRLATVTVDGTERPGPPWELAKFEN
ncbi:uncharacterized protein BXZ73DRAFT_108087 [Epithele typhae]|uniref:uncharacterized protein n=1 Tax=Epithele typhae TaxID=378194 RepID=UPI002007CF70|nr:uncharacterized protein BXZ73DRAFT_108087 [Epithele typhae]KAH9911322.1 hypothetical protein BXZ73DRAFT_108087 [Epithele typhae]